MVVAESVCFLGCTWLSDKFDRLYMLEQLLAPRQEREQDDACTSPVCEKTRDLTAIRD